MTTTPAAQALFPVTPEDREAAAKCMDRDRRVIQAEKMRTGQFDKNWLVQAFARHRQAHSLPGDVGMREAALVDAVRGALECLGTPDGYLADIGAPKTRALQRAFEAYEPHPTFKKAY